MEKGDKVCVTYANKEQKIGRILGETEKTWKIKFDGNDNTNIVKKTSDIKVIDDPETKKKEVISYETKTLWGKIIDFLLKIINKKVS